MMEQTHTIEATDDATLHRFLREATEVAKLGRVSSVRRAGLATSTSYQTGAVSVELDDGRQLKLFIKDFGTSVRPKDEPHERRHREVCFYRELLSAGELGVPRYFGSVWDEGRGRYWLLLEFVNGIPVRYCEFPYWVTAADWLGKMHATFALQPDRLSGFGFLQRHDAGFFESKAHASLRAVATASPELGRRLEHALRGYDALVSVMVNQPRTLVHGGYCPINVLVNIEGEPRRVCVIDWEEAGIGAPLFDLACLVDGFVGERLDLLLDTHFEACRASGLAAPGRNEALRTIDCFRLYRLVHSLQKYVKWDVPRAVVEKLVSEVERQAQGLN